MRKGQTVWNPRMGNPEKCSARAIELCGRKVSTDYIIAEAEKDAVFYRRSGGGITLTGGEILAQADAAVDILIKAHEIGMNTAIETCGAGRPGDFRNISEHTDQVFFDIKTMDSEKHKKLTGGSLEPILGNLKKAGEEVKKGKCSLTVRYPLIPGVNDSDTELQSLGKWLKGELNAFQLEIMPYHKLGVGKYEALGREYQLPMTEVPKKEAVERALEQIDVPGAFSRGNNPEE